MINQFTCLAKTVIEEHWCQTGMVKSTIKDIDIILRILKTYYVADKVNCWDFC